MFRISLNRANTLIYIDYRYIKYYICSIKSFNMKKVYSMRLDSELMEEFDKVAKSRNRSRSNMMEVVMAEVIHNNRISENL